MTIDPRIPTMAGRSTSVFTDQADIGCTKRVSAVRCSASGVKGELHPTKNRLRDGLYGGSTLFPRWLYILTSLAVYFGLTALPPLGV